jgi:hypothetical protein
VTGMKLLIATRRKAGHTNQRVQRCEHDFLGPRAMRSARESFELAVLSAIFSFSN